MSLIIGAMKGIGAAGPGLADLAARSIAEESRMRQRDDEAAEKRAQRDKDLAFQRETSLMLAGQRGGGEGGGGGKGGGMSKLEAGSLAEEEAAARMNMTPEELRAARASGFKSLERDVEVAGPTADGGVATGRDTKYADAKRKMFAEIASEIRLGKDYKEVTEGRGNQQRNDVAEGIVSGAIAAPAGAEKIAATKGQGAFGKGGVSEFSGKADEVGRSVINENSAQAGKAVAEAKATQEGGTPATTVQGKVTSDNGSVWVIMRDGSKRDTGIKEAGFGKALSSVTAAMAKSDFRFSKLPPEEQERRALERMAVGSTPATPAPAAPASGKPAAPAVRKIGNSTVTPL